jgi:23S rRNA pseudouridine1911/1915/1917 synthase
MSRNDGFTYRERVGPSAESTTLLAYLGDRYRHSSQEEWTARIEAGDVLVDARPSAIDLVLRPGQELVWRRPPWDEPEAPLGFAVLYEDDDLLAVSKPAGLPTLPGANFLQHTLLHQVRRYAPQAAALHRLGRWTSGLVLFALNPPARAEMARQLRAREIRKRYRALAGGDPSWDAITVDRPIGKVPHALLGSVHAANDNGKPSASRIEVLERRGDAFLCDVVIVTGRPHQIRIHLAAAGHPLVGDPLYVAGGVPAAGTGAVPGDPGYLLHAAEVNLRHPSDGRELALACEPPAELSPKQ